MQSAPGHTHLMPYSMLGTNKKTVPWFVGNYIHDSSAPAWHQHKRQRPSKHARQRAHQKMGRKDAAQKLEERRGRLQSESGYDTVGEQQNSSSSSSSTSITTSSGKLNPDPLGKCSYTKEKFEGCCSCTKEHCADQCPIPGTASGNTTLQRLLKDLHRCDVFIARSLSALNQHCADGERGLRQTFTQLQYHMKARESDLIQELQSIRQTAASILKRRKATLAYLKTTASTSAGLDEAQLAELIQQMKQFVADRKVDEEIGSVDRFHGDADDILPHIMGFGQVNNVRHLYTEWEENPDKMILRSKSSVTLLPVAAMDAEDTGTNKLSFLTDTETEGNGDNCTPQGGDGESTTMQADSGFLSVPESSLSGGSGLDDDDTSSHDESHSGRCRHSKGSKNARTKYSPQQLQTIQARVKDSLKSQGVYLYDPVTGAGPPKEAEAVEYGGGTSKHREEWQTARKKKTPTQLRRERKKRQKERERKRRELDKAVSEESDAQANSPVQSPTSPQSHLLGVPVRAAQKEWTRPAAADNHTHPAPPPKVQPATDPAPPPELQPAINPAPLPELQPAINPAPPPELQPCSAPLPNGEDTSPVTKECPSHSCSSIVEAPLLNKVESELLPPQVGPSEDILSSQADDTISPSEETLTILQEEESSNATSEAISTPREVSTEASELPSLQAISTPEDEASELPSLQAISTPASELHSLQDDTAISPPEEILNEVSVSLPEEPLAKDIVSSEELANNLVPSLETEDTVSPAEIISPPSLQTKIEGSPPQESPIEPSEPLQVENNFALLSPPVEPEPPLQTEDMPREKSDSSSELFLLVEDTPSPSPLPDTPSLSPLPANKDTTCPSNEPVELSNEASKPHSPETKDPEEPSNAVTSLSTLPAEESSNETSEMLSPQVENISAPEELPPTEGTPPIKEPPYVVSEPPVKDAVSPPLLQAEGVPPEVMPELPTVEDAISSPEGRSNEPLEPLSVQDLKPEAPLQPSPPPADLTEELSPSLQGLQRIETLAALAQQVVRTANQPNAEPQLCG